ncbi:MAG: hypothetical protein ACREU1_08610 [Burkholderiales bacterium]
MGRVPAIALFLALPVLCAAQADTPVARPEVKVGDRWIYHHWDQLGQKLVKSYELRVSFVDRNVIHTVVKRQDQEESDAMWTADWNATQSVLGEGVVNPHTGFFRFPLQAGDRYKSSFEIAFPQRGSFRQRRDYTIKVVGWEEVTVAAGRFRALKLEAGGSWQRLDAPGGGRLLSTFWYAPEAKRWVKNILEVHGPKGPGVISVEELVLFNVQ